MTAFMILDDDAEALARYRQDAAPVLLTGTVRLLAPRGATSRLPEDPGAGTHAVVLQFASPAEARRACSSQECSTLLQRRLRATGPRLAVIVPGQPVEPA